MKETFLPQPLPLTLNIHAQQWHWLHADDMELLQCTEGALLVRWQANGLPFEIILQAEDAPWHVPRLPAGTLISVRSCGSQHRPSQAGIQSRAAAAAPGLLQHAARLLRRLGTKARPAQQTQA